MPLPKFSDCAEITEMNTILDYAATNYRMLYANTPKRVGNTQHGESVHVFPDGSQITIKTKGNGNYFIRRLYVGDTLVIEAKYKANSSTRY